MWKTCQPNGNPPPTNDITEQAYRMNGGLLRDYAVQDRTTRQTRASGLPDATYLHHRMIANKFAYQFTQPPIRLTGDKSKRQRKRQFIHLSLTGTPSFTPTDTDKAIQLAESSTAIGPDGMNTLHLKKLDHGAINHLTNIFNLSISTGQIPEI